MSDLGLIVVGVVGGAGVSDNGAFREPHMCVVGTPEQAYQKFYREYNWPPRHIWAPRDVALTTDEIKLMADRGTLLSYHAAAKPAGLLWVGPVVE